MAQQTNLNVSPYFDDFDPNDNYHKILFKPGFPVQARELSGLQSILQNQIEKFGQHFFKEGAKVIPGNTAYSTEYFAVELNNSHLGVPVEFYIDQLIDRKIIGASTGVTAIIKQIIKSDNSDNGNLTLYISYMSSGVEDNSIKVFADGELLIADSDIVSGPDNNAFIPSGESFASCIANNATSTAASFSISNGVYFIRGNFVQVQDETIILSQYDNTPSARIGLRVEEDIINADEDETLADNSKGFNNYAAPGADRLKISVSLFAKPLDDFNDSNFIELAVIENGILRSQKKNTEYSFIRDELARRTFAESGDYMVRSFGVSLRDSLNDNVGNNGVYQTGQFTQGGTLASDDLAVYQISPGKAFVKGYEVETISSTYIDCPKTRTSKSLESQGVAYKTGNSVRMNNVSGAPNIGIGNTYIVSLRNQRQGSNQRTAGGSEIGVARVYDFALESGSYTASNSSVNEWDVSLYDIQLFSKLTLNEPITLSIPTQIKGKYSGATGFLVNAVSNSTSLEIYEKTGEFVTNEPFEINGIANNRVATAVTSFGMQDVKSVYGGPDLGNVGFAKTFNGDVIQRAVIEFGDANMTSATGSGAVSISTITSGNPLFPGTLKVGNILRFGGLGNNDKSLVRITEVNTTNVVVTGVTTVSGVTEGALYKGSAGTSLQVPDLTLLTSPLERSTESRLYSLMPKAFISDVDLTNSTLTIRKSFDVDVSINPNTGLGQLSAALTAGLNEFFLPFDEERYVFMRSDGTTVALRDDMFIFTGGNTIMQIEGLGAATTGCTLIATLSKSKPTAKIKRLDRVNSIVVNYSKDSASGVGGTTLNDGLSSGNFPIGTRVQDNKIVLNEADVIKIHGVFESNDTSEASAPKMTLTSLNGPSGKTTDLVIGEKLIGQNSGAVAIVAETVTDAQITYITQNETAFEEGEVIVFEESTVQGLITTLDNPSRNISSNFTFNNGQRSTFYDYGYLTRRANAKPPKKQLKIYFKNGYYESTDEGDITTRNSYSSWNFSKDIPQINGEYVTDTIDIRPKVATYQVLENVRSPLEFFGRSFTSSGNSASNILASDETITVNFSHFVGRVDRIFLDKTGKFQIKYGDPSERRERPIAVDDAIEIASILLPPFLFSPKQASIDFLKYKRYRMQDIKDLEERIKNLEYYTSLSMLETQTSNLFVPDVDGLNKFKSGFFVDNFTSLKPQETNGFKVKCSLDPAHNELRPQHYCTQVDLMPGPVEGVDTNTDRAFLAAEGTNIKKSEDVVTLDFTETEWLSQQFATRTESVTPFLVSFWQATVKLNPSSDTWTDTARIDAKIIQQEGNFAGIMAQAMQEFGVDPQTGMAPIQWNSWETQWSGTDFTERTRNRQESSSVTEEEIIKAGWINGGSGVNHSQDVTTTTTTVLQDTIRDTFRTDHQQRTGTRKIVTEQFDNESIGDRVVSRDVIMTMRSRNVQFRVTKCKPLTQLYAFFDGVAVTKYCTPKLLEITMSSGTFLVGETVVGVMPGQGIPSDGTDIPAIKFRVAQANHRTGPYNAPTEVFAKNPYISQVGATGLETFLGTPGLVQLASASGGATDMPATYSSTSTILNIDTKSLADQPQGDFFGFAHSNMELRGQTSGAQAKVTRMRLISDLGANLIGSFYIPNPNSGNHPRFETGTKTFTMIDNTTNDQENTDTFGEDTYTASGTLETVQENIISTRNAIIQTRPTKEERSVRQMTGSTVMKTEAISTSDTETRRDRWYDPLAQSFQVTESGGIFITSCDIYFQTKDDMDIPMTFQIRTMEGGTPTQKVLPFSEIIKAPDQIQVSQNGTIPTRFEFEAPVYLEGDNTEYAICLASWSTKYKVFISRIGESDLLTDEFISQQPYLGSLFKSQNASTWEPSQWEDLKFIINKAVFETEGTMEIYNPILSEGNRQVARLQPNSVNLNSKRLRVGIGTSLTDTVLTLGNTINQLAVSDGTTDFSAASNASGNFVGSSGIGTGNMGIINAGIGYSGTGTFDYVGVALTNITSGGDFMTADVRVTDGSVAIATIRSSGSGFQQGDVLGIGTITAEDGSSIGGINARLSVVSIGRTDELILDNVQGDFSLNGLLTYTHPITGITTTLNTEKFGGLGSCRAQKITSVSDGLHFTVDHRNHGMHHEQNRVTLSNVETDIVPTKLSLPYGSNSTSTISVESTDNLTTFENVAVGATNPGYIKIQDEVIKYTGASGGSITGITRGNNAKGYIKGTPVRKYELGGVSLARINRTHLMSDVTDRDPNPITFDSYTIKVDTGDLTAAQTGLPFSAPNRESAGSAASNPKLYFNDSKSTGGYHAHATQNIPFQIIQPNVANITVPGTTISAEMKTISAASLGNGLGQGIDVPFLDKGSESVTLNKTNYLSSTRMIASRINETSNTVIQNKSGNRSFNMTLTLETTDPNISPVVDLQRMSAVLVSNRVDAPITNYKEDSRVNSLFDDPTACQYVSRENTLSNSASSIKIILDAHINEFSDIRAYYAISSTPNFDPIFEPFPGFKNLNDQGQVINPAESDGRPDRFIPKADAGGFKSNELTFREYEFNMEDLPPFKFYRVKFVLTSTNQTYVPRVSNLRVITLA